MFKGGSFGRGDAVLFFLEEFAEILPPSVAPMGPRPPSNRSAGFPSGVKVLSSANISDQYKNL